MNRASRSLGSHFILSHYVVVPLFLRLMASSSTAVETPKTPDSTNAVSSCIFCKIAASATNTNILYQDDDVVAFPDIKPAAKHHTLVISRQHLVNAKVLTSEHKALVQKMVDTGKKLMQEQGIPLDDVSLTTCCLIYEKYNIFGAGLLLYLIFKQNMRFY